MWKGIIVMFFLLSCYSCLEHNEMIMEETRAKKKKGSAKLLGLILLLIVSKIAVFKTISVFLMMKFFQKLFAIGGILLKYLLNSKGEKPSSVYGAPSYDTVGYSYGPESIRPQDYPGILDIASSFDWLVNKNV